jgi:carbon-monoxide dehydrogenase medium subunit
MAGDYPDVHRATSLDDAVATLARLGDDGAALAGCTWIMRSPARGERLHATYVSLQDVNELTGVRTGDPTVIGALATHAALARLDAGAGPLGALSEAARRSANRAVRNVATLGGNVCAHPFPAADLVPALLAADAEVHVVSPAGAATLAVADFVASRGSRPRAEVVASVSVPAPAARRSWYARLTVRGSSEYPIACVAVSVDLDRGAVTSARVAVGAVEDVARRVPEAEAVLAGRPLHGAAGEEAGRAAASALTGRDAPDAPRWYRLEVLPALCRGAVARLAGEDR